jgi:RNA polymerase sigma-70 factor (ECF subfamily)
VKLLNRGGSRKGGHALLSDPPESGVCEKELIGAAAAGGISAIEDLYRSHYDTIYRYVFARLGKTAETEDVTSQVFLAMCRGLSVYEDRGTPLVAWLYGVARRQVALFQRTERMLSRSVALEEAASAVASTDDPRDAMEKRGRCTLLIQGLGALPDPQREALILRYVLSFSLAETASAMNRSEGAIKQLQQRGLAALRAKLARDRAGLDLTRP